MAGPRRALRLSCIPVACRHTIHLVDTVRRAHSMTAFDIVTEVKRYHQQAGPAAEPAIWCRGCEADWPCDTQRLVDEIEASRKKLAQIRRLHSEGKDHLDRGMCTECLDLWPCWTVRIFDGEVRPVDRDGTP